MTPYVFDDTPCKLGEGPLWHPTRQQFFWFDIQGQQLLTRVQDTTTAWDFDETLSAAAWVDNDRLLLATESAFELFSIDSGETEFVAPLESDNAMTRSNDGRADPYGGFWIGTMGKSAERKAGAIYRYYRGEVRKLFPNISIPNAICFSPDGTYAYFTDSAVGNIMRQALDDRDGWPSGEPEIFIPAGVPLATPDGAVVDADGNLWNAEWGGWRVACYSPTGEFLKDIKLNAAHTTCPAFGGADLTTLFCTSATENVSPDNLAQSDDHGKTFAVDNAAKGQAEHQVIL